MLTWTCVRGTASSFNCIVCITLDVCFLCYIQFWVIAVEESVQMSCKNVITTLENRLTFIKLSTLRTDVIILILIVWLTFTVEANKFYIFVMWYNCIMLNLSSIFFINLSFKCKDNIFFFISLVYWEKKLYFKVCVCLSRIFVFSMAWNKRHVKSWGNSLMKMPEQPDVLVPIIAKPHHSVTLLIYLYQLKALITWQSATFLFLFLGSFLGSMSSQPRATNVMPLW